MSEPAPATTAPATLDVLTSQEFDAAETLAASVYGRPRNEPAVDIWNWRLLLNPATKTSGCALGWVLRDADGKLVGLNANIPQLLWAGGQEVLAAASSHTAVLSAHRGRGLLLLGAFLRQTQPTLFLNTSANPTVVALARGFGQQELPGWRDVYFWIVKPLETAAGVLARYPLLKMLSSPLQAAPQMSGAWYAEVASLLSTGRIAGVTVSPVEAITDEFSSLWRDLRGAHVVTAVRTAEVLAWRFHGCPMLSRRSTVLAARNAQGYLLGYLAMRRVRSGPGQPSRARVVDVFASFEDRHTVAALLRAAVRTAAVMNVAVLEVAHAGAALRPHLEAAGALRRVTASGGYLFRWSKSAEVATGEKWYMSGIDGDFGL